MDLRKQLLKEHSKSQCDKIVLWIGQDQKKFDELFNLFLNDEYRVVQRAAWPMSICVEQFPELIRSKFSPLIKKLTADGNHEAVKRNTLRLLQHVKIPKRFHGIIMDKCFNFITDPKEKPAIKAFSLTVLQNLSEIYPDILPELKVIIDEKFEQETPAFRSRARKILNVKRKM